MAKSNLALVESGHNGAVRPSERRPLALSDHDISKYIDVEFWIGEDDSAPSFPELGLWKNVILHEPVQ